MERIEAERTWHRVAIAVGLLGLLLLALADRPPADLDMFHEMALIREALATGGLPRYDTFAFTSTSAPVVHHEWGTGAVLYFVAVTSGLGGTGIILLRFLLVLGTIACCVTVARRPGASVLLLAAMSPLALMMGLSGLSAVRAHLFTFFFTGCLLLLLEFDRAGARWWIAVWLPLYVVWLNMHGGFVVGAGLLGLYTIDQLVRTKLSPGSFVSAVRSNWHLLALGVVMVGALLINPYGLEYVPYLFHALTLERPFISEWAPLFSSRGSWANQVTFLFSLLLLAYALWRNRLRFPPGLLLVLVTAAMTIRSQRILPVYAIIWIAYVPAWLSGTPLNLVMRAAWQKLTTPVATIFLVGGLVFAGLAVQREVWKLHVPNTTSYGGLTFPVGAVDYLREHTFHGDVMTHFNHGSYVSWKLYPAVRVGMDSRYEVAYEPATAQENVSLYDGADNWADILDKESPDAVLVGRHQPLFDRMMDDPGVAARSDWLLVYIDDGFALFFRSPLASSVPFVDRTGEEIVGVFP
jgi:hypothetical protein